MPDALDTHAIEHTARQLLDARIIAVRELATAQVAVDHARDALATAETNHATVYAAATRAGWSDSELKHVGLVAPSRRTLGRPRRARSGRLANTTSPVADSPAESRNGDADELSNGG